MRAPACFESRRPHRGSFNSRRRARPRFGVVLAVALLSCAEKKPSAPLEEVPDSGGPCERGTTNCSCTSSGRCDSPLLCIAGRCLASDTAPDPPEPPLTRPPVTRPPSSSDGGSAVPGAAPDAASDAAAPSDDAAAPSDDASVPSDELDASPG